MYEYLEPLYNDYRKLRLMTSEGKYILTHVDEFVDSLLNSESVCGTLTLPRLPKRWELEKSSGVRVVLICMISSLLSDTHRHVCVRLHGATHVS